MSLRSHLVLLLCLLAFGAFVHRDVLLVGTALVDEEYYESGISALAETGSAYQAEGFMYPPTFAAGGLWLQHKIGVEVLRLGVRWLNFTGLILILWFSVWCYVGARCPADPPNHRRLLWLAVIALALILAPGVRLGLAVGNISFLVGAMVIAGFWLADRNWLIAGSVLGLSLLVKPLAAGSLPMLLLSPGKSTIHRKRWITAAIAGTSSLAVLAFFGTELPAMLAADLSSMAQNRTLSLYRISRLLGIGEQRLLIFSVITAAMCWGLWGRLRSRTHLLVAGLAMIPLTTLAVWSHTLVLYFPVCGVVLRRLVDRQGLAGPESKATRWLRLPSEPGPRLEVVTVLGALALIYFENSGGYPQLHPVLQILLLAPPLCAPLGLLIYWFGTEPRVPTDTAKQSS